MLEKNCIKSHQNDLRTEDCAWKLEVGVSGDGGTQVHPPLLVLNPSLRALHFTCRRIWIRCVPESWGATAANDSLRKMGPMVWKLGPSLFIIKLAKINKPGPNFQTMGPILRKESLAAVAPQLSGTHLIQIRRHVKCKALKEGFRTSKGGWTWVPPSPDTPTSSFQAQSSVLRSFWWLLMQFFSNMLDFGTNNLLTYAESIHSGPIIDSYAESIHSGPIID
jgi:hypothetical protein